jgi:hypothetical protein
MPKVKDGEVVGYTIMLDGNLMQSFMKPTYSKLNKIVKRANFLGSMKVEKVVIKRLQERC